MLPEIVFWILLMIIFYTYIGYGLIIFLLKKTGILGVKKETDFFEPDVTIIIPAYNEANIIASKIDNTLSLNYPAEKIKIIVVADGSTDNTVSILSNYKQITIVENKRRRGKAYAINNAIKHVQTPFVIFTDANCFLNADCLNHLVKHFVNKQVGAVAGEKKVLNHTGTGDAEGLYWKYESYMKQMDAALYTVVGAAGELFAMRTELFKPLNENVLLDDLILSLQICLDGYIIQYEPKAYASEAASISIKQEQARKTRIAAGAFQTLSIINFKKIFKIPLLFFQFISRRWLRWVVCPFAIILILLLNIYLSVEDRFNVFDVLLMIQIFFYLNALLGWMLIKRNATFFLTTISFYFLFMNFCMIKGLILFLNKKQSVLWQKADR